MTDISNASPNGLTHLDNQGRANMVDVFEDRKSVV